MKALFTISGKKHLADVMKMLVSQIVRSSEDCQYQFFIVYSILQFTFTIMKLKCMTWPYETGTHVDKLGTENDYMKTTQ